MTINGGYRDFHFCGGLSVSDGWGRIGVHGYLYVDGIVREYG